jgi:putative transposase
MQYIKARITEGYNRKMGRTGTLWNERFRCTIVEESDNPERYFFYLMWYIAYNPVRKGVMKNPRESKHGTIRAYLEEGFVSTIRITLHYYFINLGYSFEERAKRFLEYEDIYLKRYSHVF